MYVHRNHILRKPIWLFIPLLVTFKKMADSNEVLVEEDYYHTLGTSWNATAKEIRKAYLAKASYWHPDRNTAVDAGEVYCILRNKPVDHYPNFTDA